MVIYVFEPNAYELAWAAGFFDGEGSTSAHNSAGRIIVSIQQNSPEPLERFREAVGQTGTINGPHQRSNANPCWRYQASGFHDCQAIIALLWEFLCTPKREQARRRLTTCYREQRRRPGYCRRGHARSGDNLTTHGQCRTCMRENDRKRRATTPRPPRVYAPKNECIRGHPYEGNRTKWGQCIPCRRDADRNRAKN